MSIFVTAFACLVVTAFIALAIAALILGHLERMADIARGEVDV